MFLAAVGRPRRDTLHNRNFSGKIGILPFTRRVPALRNSSLPVVVSLLCGCVSTTWRGECGGAWVSRKLKLIKDFLKFFFFNRTPHGAGNCGQSEKTRMVSRHPLATPGIFFNPPPKCIVNHFYAFNPCVSPLFDCVAIVLIFCIIQIGLIFCVRLYWYLRILC